jgi:hypothetical protein
LQRSRFKVLGNESFFAVIIMRYLDVLVLTDTFSGLKYWPTLLETVGLRVPNRNFRDFNLFSVDFNSRNFPSARCASAADAINTDNYIFSGRSVSVNMIG